MPLTSYQGIEMSPTFSPDGKQVAFSWDGEKGDNEDIYVVMVGADNPLPITKDPARDVSAAWKPDGSQIAFARMESGRAAIYLVSPLGGSERKLTDFSAFPYSGSGPVETYDPRLAWSADGRWLAVTRVLSGTETGVFLVAEDGTESTLLKATSSDLYRMAVFAPGGASLALINDVDTGQNRLVQSFRLADVSPGLTISPDGKTIIIAGVAVVTQDLMRIENFR
jgi:Tol biopolymer transport system component